MCSEDPTRGNEGQETETWEQTLQRIERESAERECPSCKSTNDSGSQYCVRCGAWLFPDECVICYHINQPDSNYCGNCGWEMHKESPEPTPESTESNELTTRAGVMSPFAFVIGVVSLLAITLGGIGIFGFLWFAWMLYQYRNAQMVITDERLIIQNWPGFQEFTWWRHDNITNLETGFWSNSISITDATGTTFIINYVGQRDQVIDTMNRHGNR